MLKCNDCGRTFETKDLDSYQECVGEYWGTPAYETFYVCPYCGSDEYGEYNENSEEEDQ